MKGGGGALGEGERKDTIIQYKAEHEKVVDEEKIEGNEGGEEDFGNIKGGIMRWR